jgi:hypothetical protein
MNLCRSSFRRLPPFVQLRLANALYLPAALTLAVLGVLGGAVLELAGAEAA